MAFQTFLLFCFACSLFLSGIARGQTAGEYFVTARTSGAVQFRDPATLDIVSSLQINMANSTGISGVWSDPNGQTLYIEGPEHEFKDPNGNTGCCWLYSIDLQNLHAKVAAGIWGTNSRRRFVNAGPSLLATVSDEALAATNIENEQWQISPNGRWWAGFRSGPTVDIYDTTRNQLVRSFTAEKGNSDWHLNGAWIKDKFYLYTAHDGSGWLWHLSPDSDRLEGPSAVPDPTSMQGCKNFALMEMNAVGDSLVLYESFGGTMDRRYQCPQLTGGAWIIDVASQQLFTSLAPQLYFWRLIPSRDGRSIYGVTAEDSELGTTSQLVHLDAHSGKILQTRPLDRDYWWIADFNLSSIPSGDRPLVLPIKRTY